MLTGRPRQARGLKQSPLDFRAWTSTSTSRARVRRSSSSTPICDSRMWEPQWGRSRRPPGGPPGPARLWALFPAARAIFGWPGPRRAPGGARKRTGGAGGRLLWRRRGPPGRRGTPRSGRRARPGRRVLPGHAWSEEVKAFWAEEEAALERGDLDAAVEVNMRMWVDGRRLPGRSTQRCASVSRMQRRVPAAAAGRGSGGGGGAGAGCGRLGEIRAPALVVVGEADVTDLHDIAERLAGDPRRPPGHHRRCCPSAEP